MSEPLSWSFHRMVHAREKRFDLVALGNCLPIRLLIITRYWVRFHVVV